MWLVKKIYGNVLDILSDFWTARLLQSAEVGFDPYIFRKECLKPWNSSLGLSFASETSKNTLCFLQHEYFE
jgi:hypothetical protein